MQNCPDEFHSCGIPYGNYHRDNSKFKSNVIPVQTGIQRMDPRVKSFDPELKTEGPEDDKSGVAADT